MSKCSVCGKTKPTGNEGNKWASFKVTTGKGPEAKTSAFTACPDHLKEMNAALIEALNIPELKGLRKREGST